MYCTRSCLLVFGRLTGYQSLWRLRASDIATCDTSGIICSHMSRPPSVLFRKYPPEMPSVVCVRVCVYVCDCFAGRGLLGASIQYIQYAGSRPFVSCFALKVFLLELLVPRRMTVSPCFSVFVFFARNRRPIRRAAPQTRLGNDILAPPSCKTVRSFREVLQVARGELPAPGDISLPDVSSGYSRATAGGATTETATKIEPKADVFNIADATRAPTTFAAPKEVDVGSDAGGAVEHGGSGVSAGARLSVKPTKRHFKPNKKAAKAPAPRVPVAPAVPGTETKEISEQQVDEEGESEGRGSAATRAAAAAGANVVGGGASSGSDGTSGSGGGIEESVVMSGMKARVKQEPGEEKTRGTLGSESGASSVPGATGGAFLGGGRMGGGGGASVEKGVGAGVEDMAVEGVPVIEEGVVRVKNRAGHPASPERDASVVGTGEQGQGGGASEDVTGGARATERGEAAVPATPAASSAPTPKVGKGKGKAPALAKAKEEPIERLEGTGGTVEGEGDGAAEQQGEREIEETGRITRRTRGQAKEEQAPSPKVKPRAPRAKPKGK